MPGRYTQTLSLEQLEKRFGFDVNSPRVMPRYNIAPSQEAPAVIKEDKKTLRMLRWGLVPHWSKDDSNSYKSINARAEGLSQKPTFRDSFKNRRCLVLADGFYEWRESNGKGPKTPFRFILKSREPFAFAGLWDKWRKPDGETLLSFSIITTEPNDLIEPIHKRMPVILHKEHEEIWIDPSYKDISKLSSFLKPYPSDMMDFYEVSTLVNSPKNESPECIRAKKSQ